MWEFNLNWSYGIMLWNLRKIQFKINKTILSEQVDLRVVLGVKLLKTINGFGNLELINFEKLNGLIFLFGDEFSSSNDVLFMWQELFHSLAGFFENLLFGLFDLNLDRFDWFWLLLDWLRSLFFSHENEFLYNKIKVVVDRELII